MAAYLLGEVAIRARLVGDPPELGARVTDAADLQVVPTELCASRKPPPREVRVVGIAVDASCASSPRARESSATIRPLRARRGEMASSRRSGSRRARLRRAMLRWPSWTPSSSTACANLAGGTPPLAAGLGRKPLPAGGGIEAAVDRGERRGVPMLGMFLPPVVAGSARKATR